MCVLARYRCLPTQYSPLTVSTAPPPEYITEDQRRTMPAIFISRPPPRLSGLAKPGRPRNQPAKPGLPPPESFLPKNRHSNSASPTPISALHFSTIGGLPCSALVSSSAFLFWPRLPLSVSHSNPSRPPPQAVTLTTAVRSTSATIRSPLRPTKFPMASRGRPVELL